MAFKVVAPYVTLKVRSRDSGAMEIRGYYAGATVPDEVDPENLKHHLDTGMVVNDSPKAKNADDAAAMPAESTGQQMGGGPPQKSDSKAAWVDYAVSKRADGVSEEDARLKAEAMSKADLVAAYGG